jgi:hypothetical protein
VLQNVTVLLMLTPRIVAAETNHANDFILVPLSICEWPGKLYRP